MATVGSALTVVAQSPTPILAQPGVAPGSQAAVTPAQTMQQADSVTLTGRTAETQQNGDNSNGSAQFGEASAFFFAEQQSFRAGNGSGGNQAATPTVPNLPVKTVNEASVGNEQNESVANGQTAPTANQASAPNSAANAATGGAGSIAQTTGSTSGGNGAADTPMAELAQLDDTLQQMGIDPQSISLFNRMAMLLYANDPAALRVLVQTMQSGAEQLTAANSSGQNNGGATGTQAANSTSPRGLLPAQAQSTQAQNAEYQPANVQNNAEEANVLLSDATIASIGTENGGTALTEPLTLPTYAASSNGASAVSGEALDATSSAQFSPSSAYVAQLGQLNSAFAAVEGRQFNMLQQNAEAGQLLNVSA